MGTVLVTYRSKEEQIEKIAGHIVVALAAHEHDMQIESVTDIAAAETLAGAGAVFVGSSVHLDVHLKSVYGFAREHHDDIEAQPNGFLQVSLSSALDDTDTRAEVATYLDEFAEESGWPPERTTTSGRAFRYSGYDFLTRLVMRRTVAGATGDTNASQDYEYTDWDEVEPFAADFVEYVEPTADIVTGGAAV